MNVVLPIVILPSLLSFDDDYFIVFSNGCGFQMGRQGATCVDKI